MLLVLRAFLHPAAQQGHLLIIQALVRFRRGHSLLRILRLDAMHEWALVRLARHDGGAEFSMGLVRELRAIESQLGLARPGIWPVAAVAVLGEDRLDAFVEAQLLLRRPRATREQQWQHDPTHCTRNAQPQAIARIDHERNYCARGA